MAGIFGIGVSGIQAAQMGLLVTQHNITNANTAGYNRQSAIQTTATPLGTASGFTGNGTRVSTVERQYNSFLSQQLSQNQTVYSALESNFTQVQVIDDLLADASAGVSPALQQFFEGVQQVASAPSSLPARQSMVSAAQSLASRMQSVSQRFSELSTQINGQISDNVALINTYAKQIAKLNETITLAESTVNQPANDLRDQRDQLIADLNKVVKVQTMPEGKSGVDILIGNGQQLVSGNQARLMSAVKSTDDPSRTVVSIEYGNGGKQVLPDSFLSGAGSLGGLLDFRSQTLDPAINTLGKVAASLALTFNAQHGVGMDMLGNNGSDSGFQADFFTLPKAKVMAASGNTGGVSVSATLNPARLTDPQNVGNYVTDIGTSDYRLEYDGGLTLTRLSDGVTWSGADMASINAQINDETDARGLQGFTLAEDAATYALGDRFLIQPTRGMAENIAVNSAIAGDVRLVAAGSAIRASVGLTNQGTMSAKVDRMLSGDPQQLYPMQVTYNAGQLDFDPAYNGQTVSIVDATGSSDYTIGTDTIPLRSGVSYVVDGVMFSLSGTPKDGDTFSLDWNDGQSGPVGVSDTSNIVLLGKLQNQNTVDGGAANYQAAYTQLVSDVGNRARQLEVTKDAQNSLVSQASAAREAISGVNLDEEAAKLLQFQQMYQASARSISVGQKLFDELLSIAG